MTKGKKQKGFRQRGRSRNPRRRQSWGARPIEDEDATANGLDPAPPDPAVAHGEAIGDFVAKSDPLIEVRIGRAEAIRLVQLIAGLRPDERAMLRRFADFLVDLRRPELTETATYTVGGSRL